MQNGQDLRISIDLINRNPDQPRKNFNENSLLGLAKSIKNQGVLQPLVVRKDPNNINKYQLIAGERRWRALKMLNFAEVPIILKEVNDDEILELGLIENIQREDLNPIEEATSYKLLIDKHNYKQEELANRLGKERSTINNLMRLLKLPSPIKNDLEKKRMTIGHARALLSLNSIKLQLDLREKILKYNLSVRETEKNVKEINKIKLISSKKENKKNLLISLEEELQRKLGTKVSIKFSNNNGEIIIRYQNLEEFDRLFSILKSI